MNKVNLIVPLMYTLITTMILMLWNNFHPTHLILLLILYSLMICMNLSVLKNTFLYSIIMFLIIISSVLIIFLYFSSLISNEKVNLKGSKKILLMTMMFSFSSMLIMNFSSMTQPMNKAMEMNMSTQLQSDMFCNIK